MNNVRSFLIPRTAIKRNRVFVLVKTFSFVVPRVRLYSQISNATSLPMADRAWKPRRSVVVSLVICER